MTPQFKGCRQAQSMVTILGPARCTLCLLCALCMQYSIGREGALAPTPFQPHQP